MNEIDERRSTMCKYDGTERKVLNDRFIAALREENRRERFKRHPQMRGIMEAYRKISKWHDEVDAQSARRAASGVAIPFTKRDEGV